MGTYGDKLRNYRSYEETITPVLCRVLVFCAISIPVLIICSRTGIYPITTKELIGVSLEIFVATVVPFILLKSGFPYGFLKYFIAISITATAAVISLMPGTAVDMGFLIGLAVGLIYLDIPLLIITGIFTYFMMLLSLMIQSMGLFFSDKDPVSLTQAMESFIPRAVNSSIEFVILFPVFVIVGGFARRHLSSEEELFLELSTEEERYRLAFEGSNDVIFDYVYQTDVLTYYGAINDPGVDNSKEHVVPHAMDYLSSGKLIHHDDIGKVISLLNGSEEGALKVRLCTNDPGEFKWIRIEGRVVKKGEEKIRVVGKVEDITEERRKDEDFLENAKLDPTTGFYTWNIGERLIEKLEGESEGSMFYLFFKIMNLDFIVEQYGSFFMDAIISRVGDSLSSVLKEEDYIIRINAGTFAAFMTDTDESMITLIHSSLEHSLEHIYTGDKEVDGLDYVIRFCRTKEEFLRFVGGEETTEIISHRKSNELNYDAVSFTFNILEHSKNIESSMIMLLEYIGNLFNIVSIHIVEKDETPGLETCLYEWSSIPGNRRFKAGDKRESDTSDLRRLYDAMSRSDNVIVNESFLAGYSNDFRSSYLEGHTSHLLIPIHSGGELMGHIDYEHLNVYYDWSDDTKTTLVEMTRCISSYLLRDRANNASKAKSDFLSSISHEIRTPLNAISGFSELMLAKDDLDEQSRKYTEGIKGSSDNLLAIISGILDFSKIESGQIEIMHEKFRLSKMLLSIYQMTVLSAEEKGLGYDIRISGEVPDGLIGDEQRIKQVLLNLVGNSVKFTNSGSVTLTVSYQMLNDQNGVIRVDVKDTGIGIKPEEKRIIFDSFQHVDKSNNKSVKGVGLGLSISRDLLHMMDGSITCESIYGSGSTFSVSVPVEVYDNTASVFDPESSDKKGDSFSIPFVCPKAKILIVDDNKVNLEVAKGLIGQYGAEIKTAMSGDEALNIFFREKDFDLVFMDHMMPKMDGIECVSHMRRLNVDIAADVPIVALTANAVKGARKLFLSAGMNDYLPKPIRLNELADVMTKWIPDKYKMKPEDFGPVRKVEVNLGEETGEPVEGLPGIDYKAGIQNVLGSEETYKELLKTFVDSDSMSEAENYYKNRDLENYRITVHGLKSSARYIGANELSDHSKLLEDLAKEGNWSGIDEQHVKLKPLYDGVVDSINGYLDIHKDADTGEKVDIDHDSFLRKVEEIVLFMDDMDFDSAANIADGIRDIDYEDKSVLHQFKEGIKYLDNFDFEEALDEFRDVITRLS